MGWSSHFHRIGLPALAVVIAGCAGITRPPSVPEPLIGQAIVPGFAEARYIHGFGEAAFISDYQAAMRAAPPGPDGVSVLALSGGGPNGAFGAGVLVGWTETGNRPTFQVVTGVSTGALAAPFAFLGPAYDDRLKKAYTGVHDADIFVPRLLSSLFHLLHVDSVTDTKSFQRSIKELIDQPMLELIAAEHARGRRLYVCTHDIVSGRAVFWNLTAIAASRRADALALFHKVLLASASVPIVFPPQYFDVEAGGARHTEVHVDGGLSRQVFAHLNGAQAGLAARADKAPTPLTVFLIRNGQTRAPYNPIQPTVLPIALRTTEALVSAQGVGDLFHIYSQAVAEQAAFRLLMIPEHFSLRHEGVFEPGFMRRLFELGRETVKASDAWLPRPPFMSSLDGR
jgi:predicted patatin/cPLA2 family phospholipase